MSKIVALFFLFAFAGTAIADNVNRSTEYISPFGLYTGLQAAKTLTTGIQATSAGTPANAAQSTFTINGNLQINQGNTIIDEMFNVGNTFETYPLNFWTGTHFFGINTTTIPNNEGQVNGNIYAKYFRSASGSPLDADQLLYFGVTSDEQWVELGAKCGVGGFANPYSAARFEASPAIILNSYSGGNVGIGVANPLYKLQVGDFGSGLYAIGYAWNTFSSRQYKKDISVFSQQDIQRVFSEIDNLNIVRFRYKKEKPDDPLRIGLIVEEAPQELLTDDGTTISTTNTIGFLVAGIQTLKSENEALEKDITKLEKAISALEKKKRLS
jgi:hypothetical protein